MTFEVKQDGQNPWDFSVSMLDNADKLLDKVEEIQDELEKKDLDSSKEG